MFVVDCIRVSFQLFFMTGVSMLSNGIGCSSYQFFFICKDDSYLDLLCQTSNRIYVFILFTVISQNCNIRFVSNAEYFLFCEIQS